MENSKRLAEAYLNIDQETLVMLKGHLLIEERLNNIIEIFVHHGEKVGSAKLSFFQKIHIAKSMSLERQDSSVWTLIEQINSLRNDFAHKLDSDKRESKIESIRKMYKQEMEGQEYEADAHTVENSLFLAYAISYCNGFLGGLESEIYSFKETMNLLIEVRNKRLKK